MKFKHFLLEAKWIEDKDGQKTRGVAIKSEKQAISKLVSNCSKALTSYKKNRKIRIYRGTDRNEEFLSYDSTVGERTSANTANYYTLLMDYILTSGKDYPKRGKGLICTTDLEYTYSFGNRYLVVPYDNAKIAQCSSLDIGGSFENNFLDQFDGFQYFIDLILYTAHNIAPGFEGKLKFDISDWKSFDNTLSKASDILLANKEKAIEFLKSSDVKSKDYYQISLEKAEYKEKYMLWFKSWFKKDKDLVTMLDYDWMNPKPNGFQIIDDMSKLKSNREVGIEGKAIFILHEDKSFVDDILKSAWESQ